MKSGKGARKHEQAVRWQQEVGTAPGRCQIPEPRAHPEPTQPPGPSPALPAGRSLGLLVTEERLWGCWWMLHRDKPAGLWWVETLFSWWMGGKGLLGAVVAQWELPSHPIIPSNPIIPLSHPIPICPYKAQGRLCRPQVPCQDHPCASVSLLEQHSLNPCPCWILGKAEPCPGISLFQLVKGIWDSLSPQSPAQPLHPHPSLLCVQSSLKATSFA